MLEECRPDPRELPRAKLMAKSGNRWQHFSRRMPPSSLRRVAQYVLFGTLCSCLACGATGLDWVGEAHLESTSQQRVSALRALTVSAPSSASIPATVEHNTEQPLPRPRLSHTVTLGEIDAAATRAEAGPQALPAPSVVVNNYHQVNVVAPALGYGYYGFSRTLPVFSPDRATPYGARPSASSPLPGQDWPAIADQGPSFPYRSLPASPWTRAQ